MVWLEALLPKTYQVFPDVGLEDMDAGWEQGPSSLVRLLPPVCMFTWGLILTGFKQVEEVVGGIFHAKCRQRSTH